MAASSERGGVAPLPDFSGLSLRALADDTLLDPADRSVLAEALRRLRAEDDSIPSLLSHDDTP